MTYDTINAVLLFIGIYKSFCIYDNENPRFLIHISEVKQKQKLIRKYHKTSLCDTQHSKITWK
jgi:hypothetical protein